MAGRRLATFVHVADSVGAVHTFGPEDTVPAWAEKAIVNPKAWADAGTGADLVVPAGNSDSTNAATDPAGELAGAVFDPAEHSVVEVLAYLEGLSDDQADEYVRVTEAEAAGKARKGILEA